MERSLFIIFSLGTTLFVSSFCENGKSYPEQPAQCLLTAARIEYNSIKHGSSDYTRQNALRLCYNSNLNRTVFDVESLLECSEVAYSAGINSFSFENGVCEISSFYVTRNSSDVLFPIPPDNVDTKVVFIAWPPANELLASFDQEPGFPSMQNVNWTWLEFNPLKYNVSLSIAGRRCFVDSVHYKMTLNFIESGYEMDLIDDQIQDSEINSYTIESTRPFCDFYRIYVIMFYKNADGTTLRQEENLRTTKRSTEIDVSFKWLNLDTNYDKGEIEVTVNLNNEFVSKIDIVLQGDIIANDTDIGDNQTLTYHLSFPGTERTCYFGSFRVNFYDKFGCYFESHTIYIRSVCKFSFYVDVDGQTLSGYSYAEDFCTHCVLMVGGTDAGTFFDNHETCARLESLDNIPYYMLEITSDREMEVVRHAVDCGAFTWAGYYKNESVWRWPDGSTELNSTLIDVSEFDPEGHECTVFKDVQSTLPTLMNFDCNSTEPCQSCMLASPSIHYDHNSIIANRYKY